MPSPPGKLEKADPGRSFRDAARYLAEPLAFYHCNLVLIGFSEAGALHPVSPLCFQRFGHCVPLSFAAVGGKIQATRFAGGR